MNCHRCQTDNPPAARFCLNCGAALIQHCSNCQTELPAGARFCPYCGQPVHVSAPADDASLTATPAPPVEETRAAAPLAGERRVVTVLFADVVGSTALADQMDVEAWTAVMNRAFDQVTPAIHRYEGTIVRLLGDAVVAFFGTPVAHEDDPVRAVRAALELLDAAREYAAEVHQEYGVEFAMRACLSTGPMVVGPVGGDIQHEHAAMGGVINLAACLKLAGPPMAVLISEDTYRFVAPFFDCADLGSVEVRGRTEPLHVYQVRGPKAEPSQVRGLTGLKSPMVGRDAELAALLQLSGAVRAGLGRAALVVGEPGLGKTRLIAEWQTAVAGTSAEPSPQWATGRCLSYGQELAYHLLLDLLRSLIGVPAAAGEPETRTALLALAQDLFGDSALDVYPYLGHLLSLELEAAALERVQPLDPQALQAQYLSALWRLLQTLAARRPLVLILENLQWADPSSTELLIDLLPLASTAPLLFCLVARPDRDAPGWKLAAAAREVMGQRLTELTLSALSEPDSQQLVSNLLGIEVLPEQMRTLILKRAEGNPFFVEEVIRMLIDQGMIVQENGGWVIGTKIKSAAIPDNLQGLLLARIDRLPDDVKNALRVAAVIGRQFPVEVLEQVLGMEGSGARLFSILNTLESVDLIRVAHVAPELTYLFQHALVWKAAYGSLLEADRQQLHRDVGETLERLYPERLSSRELAPRLGQHFYAAGDDARALKYYTLAGDAALSSCANQEAESRYRKALKLARSETERAPLLSGLGQALYWQSRFAETIQVWREGIDLYWTLGLEDSDGVAQLYARSARAAWSGGDTPESLRLCQEGMAALANAPASPGLALLLHETARAYLFNGLPDKARPLCQQALEMAEHLGIMEVQAEALATLGLLSDQPPEVALAVLTQALELAESAGLLSQAARAHVNLASLLSTTLPDFRAAHGHYQRAAELHRLRGNTAGELFARGGMTSVSLLLGDFEEAEATLPMLRQLLDQVADPGPAVFHIRDIEALLLRYQGELAMAARLLRALQTEERHRGNLQNLIDVNNQLAEVLLEPYVLSGSVEVDDDSHPARQGWEVAEAALEEAEAALVEAIAICDRWSTGRVWPRCLLSMVRTCQGRFEDAHRLLAEAREAVSSPPIAFNEVRLSLAEARLTAAEERWPETLAAFEAAAGIYARLGLRWWRARMLQEWAEVHFSRREPTDLERAQVLFREALATFEELGVSRYAALVADRLLTLRAATYAQALAHQKAAQELAVAGRIQESFLPAEPPRVPGWQLTATLEPARETSGDFYDFIPLPNGRLGIVIADVADKGAGAALYMTLSRTLIRTYAAEYDTQPELVLGAVNRRILGDTQADLFVTVFYGILDPTTGRLTYSNAGHNPPILLRARDGAAVPTLRKTGTPLGIWTELTWGQQMAQLAPGDALVLYTDGVTDAENEEVVSFGPERLLAVVQANRGRSAEDMQAALLAAVQGFVGDTPQFDDLTLMVVVRDATGERGAG